MFFIEIEYEKLQELCAHCNIIGHSIGAYKKRNTISDENAKSESMGGGQKIHVPMQNKNKEKIKEIFYLTRNMNVGGEISGVRKYIVDAHAKEQDPLNNI